VDRIQTLPSQLEAQFNKWYDQVHVPLVTGGGHFLSLTRYCLTDAMQSNLTKYMAVCEFSDEETFRDWLVSEARAEEAADTAETWPEQDVGFLPKGCVLHDVRVARQYGEVEVRLALLSLVAV